MALLDWLRSRWRRPAAQSLVPPPPRPPHVEVRRLTLGQVLRGGGPLSEGEAVALGRELCRLALVEPGPRRLRLLCLHNLFFTPAGALACTAGAQRFWSLAPEEVRGGWQDERTDVYAVGLTMYAALLGGPAFPGHGELEVLMRARDAALEPLPARPSAPLGLVLDRALRVDAAERFPSLEVLAEALGGLPRDAPRLQRRVTEAWRALTPTRPPEPAPSGESTEERLLERLRAGDERARLVFADLLEAKGHAAEAEWVRLEHRLRGLTGEARLEALTALRQLAVPWEFMATVARPELETCGVTLGFRCPRTWDALTLTAEPLVRFCPACEERVTFVTSFDEAHEHALAGHCIAVPEVVERGPGKLGDDLRVRASLGHPRRLPGWKR